MLLLAPAILLIQRNDRTPGRIVLEWIGLLTASLAISTIPASYNFVLMVFPVCALAALLIERGMKGWLIALIVAYLGIGFPMRAPGQSMGPAILFFIPRLFLMVAVLVGIYLLLGRNPRAQSAAADWSRYAWASLMVVAVLLNAHSTLQAGTNGTTGIRLPGPARISIFAQCRPSRNRLHDELHRGL
jgi:hypothetical protein